MKNTFQEPTLELLTFNVEDVITVSTATTEGIELPDHEWE